MHMRAFVTPGQKMLLTSKQAARAKGFWLVNLHQTSQKGDTEKISRRNIETLLDCISVPGAGVPKIRDKCCQDLEGIIGKKTK